MPPHPPSYDALFEMQLEGAQRLVYALKRFSWTFIQENFLHRVGYCICPVSMNDHIS
jgi:hypothetical protein